MQDQQARKSTPIDLVCAPPIGGRATAVVTARRGAFLRKPELETKFQDYLGLRIQGTEVF